MTTSYTLFFERDDEQVECKHKNNRHATIKRVLDCHASIFGMVATIAYIAHADGTALTEAEDDEIASIMAS